MARDRALEIGRSFVAENQSLFHESGVRTQFRIETCSEIQRSQPYGYFYQNIKQVFEQNPEFRRSVEEFSRQYQSRNRWQYSDRKIEENVQKSCEYFLEEFAIFACLQQRGFPVMVYPGAFSPLVSIVNGEYPELVAEVQQLILVSMHFKTRAKFKRDV